MQWGHLNLPKPLLPNSITYPEGGIYNIQLEQEDSPEENNEAVESVESVSQPE